jgi:hypothetical protein
LCIVVEWSSGVQIHSKRDLHVRLFRSLPVSRAAWETGVRDEEEEEEEEETGGGVSVCVVWSPEKGVCVCGGCERR